MPDFEWVEIFDPDQPEGYGETRVSSAIGIIVALFCLVLVLIAIGSVAYAFLCI